MHNTNETFTFIDIIVLELREMLNNQAELQAKARGVKQYAKTMIENEDVSATVGTEEVIA